MHASLRSLQHYPQQPRHVACPKCPVTNGCTNRIRHVRAPNTTLPQKKNETLPCDTHDGPRDDHMKWRESQKGECALSRTRGIFKNDTDEHLYTKQKRTRDTENKLRITRGKSMWWVGIN